MITSPYHGPSSTSTLSFGNRSIAIVRPTEPDRLLNDPAVLALNQQCDYMPYWAYLWPGAYLLAEAVSRHPWNHGTRALEIGCGIGLAGLVGVASGLSVTFTDYDATPLEFVSQSCSANGFSTSSFSTQLLDWNDLPKDRYPVILGADVLYEKRLVPLVCDLIRTMLEPGGTAWVAGPYRVATESLDGVMSSRGLISQSETISTVVPSLGRVEGTLHRIRHQS